MPPSSTSLETIILMYKIYRPVPFIFLNRKYLQISLLKNFGPPSLQKNSSLHTALSNGFRYGSVFFEFFYCWYCALRAVWNPAPLFWKQMEKISVSHRTVKIRKNLNILRQVHGNYECNLKKCWRNFRFFFLSFRIDYPRSWYISMNVWEIRETLETCS